MSAQTVLFLGELETRKRERERSSRLMVRLEGGCLVLNWHSLATPDLDQKTRKMSDARCYRGGRLEIESLEYMMMAGCFR